MTDRKLLLEQLERLAIVLDELMPKCAELVRDAITLLKEQEAAKPIFVENPYTHLPVSYCPQCREPIDEYIVGNPYKMTKFCNYCGKAVKWND